MSALSSAGHAGCACKHSKANVDIAFPPALLRGTLKGVVPPALGDSFVGSLVAGRYRVLRKLGEGGMGTVYEAEQQPLQRKVAIKVLGENSDANARERFVREARAASRLHHPNIATVYDFGNAPNGPYLAMEFIDGLTLREVMIETGVVPWQRAHTLAMQIARGLAAAHHEGIVHRDIKPENLIVHTKGGQETIKILDFGLANLVSSVSPSLTQSGFIMGTAGYISPEQLEGVNNDVRSDLYALGIILYEMLAGTHPFTGKTAAALAIAHATKKPRPLKDVVGDAPPALCELVDRLLSKSPADRPADAGALVRALSAALGPRNSAAIESGTGKGWVGMVDDDAPRGRVTLVFTDIEGSTSIWEREPRAMRLALDTHNTVMRDAIETHRGYEVKTQGDSFMIAFGSEVDAVKWCLSAQRALREQTWPSEITRGLDMRADKSLTVRTSGMRVRMGMHLGEPDCRRGPVTGRMDYFGPMVNRAARIEGAAHGGQILMSAAVADAVGNALDGTDATITSHGAHTLKGIEGTEVLAELVDKLVSGQSFPTLRTGIPARQSNLQGEHSVFVGRRPELTEIRESFASGARLVTLIGPGGTGKTRLSRVAAQEQLTEPGGPGQVWFCDLSAAKNAIALVAIVADVLSIPLVGGAELSDAIALVGRSLSSRGSVFLVVDNLEQVIEEAAEPLAIWLAASAELRVLATSREALSIDGEIRMELDPLDVEGGVELFEARVKELGRPPTGEPDVVKELVAALDGMPLAIELAASRIGLMKPKQILERLSKRFDLLRGTRRGVDARQATLRGAIDWSWDLLSEVERAAFAQLAVFEGGFAIEAAEEVLDLNAFEDAPYALDIVQALKDKSLLRTETAHGHELRLTMLQSIHDYASGKLAVSSDGGLEAHERHATYFVREGMRNAKATKTASKPTSMAWLASNRQNLFAVCRRCASHSPGNAVTASLALQPLLAERDPTDPHRRHLLEATDWARDAGNAVPLAEVLFHHSELEQERGDAETALALVEEALALVSSHRAPVLEAALLAHQARVFHRLGRMEDGAAALNAAEPLARTQGSHAVLARILNIRGLLALAKMETGQNHLGDALRVARRSGDPEMEARVLGNIGVDHMVRGRMLEAQASMLKALELHRTHESRGLAGLTMGNMGSVVLALGRAEEAERWLRDAIGIHRELGNTHLEAADLSNLSRTLIEVSRIPEAIECATQALAFIEENSGARERLLCLCNLAVAHACAGEVDSARRYYERLSFDASTFWQSQANLAKLVETHLDLAAARLDGGDPEDPRALAAKVNLEELLNQGQRLFMPIQSLERCVHQYPDLPPVVDPRTD